MEEKIIPPSKSPCVAHPSSIISSPSFPDSLILSSTLVINKLVYDAEPEITTVFLLFFSKHHSFSLDFHHCKITVTSDPIVRISQSFTSLSNDKMDIGRLSMLRVR